MNEKTLKAAGSQQIPHGWLQTGLADERCVRHNQRSVLVRAKISSQIW